MKLELNGGWTVADYGDEEIRQTSGPLSIVVGNRFASQVLDNRSKTTRDEIRVALYPLALWLASSWWRLRWESEKADSPHTTSWRMAHELAASGYGYTWPRILFCSDGETVEITSTATESNFEQPIRYLQSAAEVVSGSEFERVIDEFLDLVLARLDDVGLHQTALCNLWTEVLGERRDPAASRYRRLEAQLGYDPDEASPELIERLVNVSQTLGADAVSEVASACAGYDPAKTFAEIYETAKLDGIEAKLVLDPRSIFSEPFDVKLPWEKGYKLASAARKAFNIPSGPVSDEALADIFTIKPSVLSDSALGSRISPLGLAVRDQEASSLKLLFHRRVYESRRFEAARFLGDFLAAPVSDNWHPVTDFRTARQKQQRAFAAELLCPIADLQEFLDGDMSDELLDEAGAYFKISPRIVEHHRNNNLLNLILN